MPNKQQLTQVQHISSVRDPLLILIAPTYTAYIRSYAAQLCSLVFLQHSHHAMVHNQSHHDYRRFSGGGAWKRTIPNYVFQVSFTHAELDNNTKVISNDLKTISSVSPLEQLLATASGEKSKTLNAESHALRFPISKQRIKRNLAGILHQTKFDQ